MPGYVIVRCIPEIVTAEREELRHASGKSNGVLEDSRSE